MELTLNIFSGVEAATSSISTPPAGLPTSTGPCAERSSTMAKYVSLDMSNDSATMTCCDVGERGGRSEREEGRRGGREGEGEGEGEGGKMN